MDYDRAIPILEAEDMLRAFQVADWPNLKKERRRALHNEIKRQAKPNFTEEKLSPVEEAVSMLRRKLNG